MVFSVTSPQNSPFTGMESTCLCSQEHCNSASVIDSLTGVSSPHIKLDCCPPFVSSLTFLLGKRALKIKNNLIQFTKIITNLLAIIINELNLFN